MNALCSTGMRTRYRYREVWFVLCASFDSFGKFTAKGQACRGKVSGACLSIRPGQGLCANGPDKATTDRHARTLRELVKQPDNKNCADCRKNGARLLFSCTNHVPNVRATWCRADASRCAMGFVEPVSFELLSSGTAGHRG